MNGIVTVREHFCNSVTVLVGSNAVALCFFCVVIAARVFEVDFKNSVSFGTLRHTLRFAVAVFLFGNIGVRLTNVLDKTDIALDNDFFQRHFGCVQFQLIVLCLSSDGIHRVAEQIACARRELLDRPVIAAYIIGCFK